MATTIEGIAVATHGWRTRRSALRLAVKATNWALEDAGRNPEDVDLLINAGLYHDRNLGEPALAPLIQADAGINPSDPLPGVSGTFSFDVANGACGVLTGLQIADGFLRSGSARTAVVVAGDADPGHGMATDFPFEAAAGALVCEWNDSERGLVAFGWRNDPSESDIFTARLGPAAGRNILTISEDPAFVERVAAVGAVTARALLAGHGLSIRDVDAVVASPGRPMFVKCLGTELDIVDESIVTSSPELHTASFISAFQISVKQRRVGPGDLVLFVCGAAGLTAGAALYRA